MLQGSVCAIKTEAAAEINVRIEAIKAGKTVLMTFQIREKHPKISKGCLFS